MDIEALSMVMSQSRVQESAGIAVMEKVMDIGGKNASQMIEMMKNNVAVDVNLGQHLDAIV